MAAPAPVNLRCEYRVNPLGIDELQPRLSWQLADRRRGARQTAYQVVVTAVPPGGGAAGGTLWDSGKVASDENTQIVYAGTPLGSRQRCAWKVRVWDQLDTPTPWSDAATWEMGLLAREEWQAQWIGSALVGGRWTTIPCPYLRTSFTLTKPIARARLYATALGVYECHLNGKRVGTDVLTPGWTDYRKRVYYQTYDVTTLLRPGRNALGAILGDGWYCGHILWRGRQHYGDRPRLLAQLLVEFRDGSSVTVASDANWKVCFGPILESDLLMGESYDARRALGAWSSPSYNDRAWQPVTTFDDHGAALKAQCGPTVTRMQELQPIADPIKDTRQWGRTKWVFDLGQNMVGRIRLNVKGPAGATLTIRHAEILNSDGTIYTTNLRTAKQTDHYTLRGGGWEVYEPHFTFHGFRYVEISGGPAEMTFTRASVTGIVLYSNIPMTGRFECSEPLLNQFYRNVQWGHRGNFLDIPTDCPQRDERLGWTGDAQVFVRAATFNGDVAGFFTKWQIDLADAQSPRGAIPPTVPTTDSVGEGDGGPAWADAVVICPWTIYQAYGDRRLLERHYKSMAHFIEFLKEDSRDLIRAYDGCPWAGFGDWLSINAETPRDLIGTAFFAYCAHLMSRIAAVLGKQADARAYKQLFEQVRAAFIKRFVTPTGVVAGQTQTAYILALHFNLLPDALRPAAIEELVTDIKKRGMHLSAGFVGSPYIQHVLTESGHADVAFELLFQTSWPSWLYAVTQGATTIWERWDGWTHDKGFQDAGMNSFNHYAYGAVADWLFERVAGIDTDPAQPGYKHVLMRPCPTARLKHVKASYSSSYGAIESAWRWRGATWLWQVTIPPNTRATLHIPAARTARVLADGKELSRAADVTVVERGADAAIVQVPAGCYEFSVTTNAGTTKKKK